METFEDSDNRLLDYLKFIKTNWTWGLIKTIALSVMKLLNNNSKLFNLAMIIRFNILFKNDIWHLYHYDISFNMLSISLLLFWIYFCYHSLVLALLFLIGFNLLYYEEDKNNNYNTTYSGNNDNNIWETWVSSHSGISWNIASIQHNIVYACNIWIVHLLILNLMSNRFKIKIYSNFTLINI